MAFRGFSKGWSTVKFIAGLTCTIFCLLMAAPVRAAPSMAERTPPYFESGACLFPAPDDGLTECGYLVAPEDREKPEGNVVRLPVVIFRSRSEDPAPDPVVFFDGGPGSSVLNLAGLFAVSPIRETRDLILLEQRGNDWAEPSLDCPEVDRAMAENLAVAGSVEEETAHVAEAAARCRDRLASAGVDLSMYHSAATAADFEDLRLLLGCEQWNLYGISYGTRLAMFYLRDYPAHVRSVVLDSIYPPEIDTYKNLVPQAAEVFQSLFDACAEDTRCRAAYPDLERHFYRLVGDLNADPVLLQAGETDILFNGNDLTAVVFNVLYDSSAVPLLPLIIEEVYRGHYEVLVPIASAAASQLAGINWGKYYSVECHEEWPFNEPEAVAASFRRYPHLPIFIPFAYDLRVCPVWNSGRADAAANQPVAGDIPTLILSGEFDPITRPEFGRIAEQSLDRAYRYEFAGMAHAISLGGCAQQMMLEFLEDPSAPPDATCAAELSRSPFAVSGDWHLTSAVYRLNDEVLSHPDLFRRGALGFALLFFLAEVFLTPGRAIRARRRRADRPDPLPARIARFLGFLAALLGLAFWAGLILALSRTIAAASYLMIGFGVPASFGWVFVIPWLTALPAAGMAVLLVPVWRRGYWRLLDRLHLTLLTLAAWVFVIFCFAYGLAG
jgi:pimeloyl-ACP methyl ester carboxylesterase